MQQADKPNKQTNKQLSNSNQ